MKLDFPREQTTTKGDIKVEMKKYFYLFIYSGYHSIFVKTYKWFFKKERVDGTIPLRRSGIKGLC